MDNYRLIRARRKTLSLRVTLQGEIEVRAPMRLSRQVIEGFLREKEGWLRERQALVQSRLETQAQVRQKGPENLPLLGRDYPWELGEGKKAVFYGERFLLPGETFSQSVPALEILYRQLARQTLEPLTREWARRLGLVIQGIRITGACTRWGSCSPKGWINYSWRLILAPREAVESVVVHELCHLWEPNHSRRFWALVAKFLPDHRARSQLLRPVQERLAAEGWDRPENR